ncbi:Methylated-DNA-(protein)-cysteine S-methyltransferase [Nitrosococcus oceani ATCC 19707]|uniref:methylated-DNA--[protein]-cysteine S-methyltransferase n=3 Tax=Nitrosococcus oceani TaxID=1229 RepID=Q3J8Y2_NITOC|nr:methylated-DNA--[protein]-cysteine S-methyltransferase [Nitrosococcus oceani]ABA58714.1 Methylated-DNA-(protein)-cysteine S-methyltransferase [Nitrosococcus oceani ATCC 19707]EDZ66991.1 methylated-DNA-(protein)-cysteine S-methyltransferase [Nitrosococcus oceani AFC27]KFI18792.1 cysteine methyltransferase [Nitrosococcus oceani C-27]GEM19194.1 methylated-DNA--protein-cysteine methyltransferase [Nitrosococcus oceani]
MVHSVYGAIVATPLGKLGLSTSGNILIGLDFLPPNIPEYFPSDSTARVALAQLQAYFADPRVMFTLSLLPQGTAFQKRVWHTLRLIPPGSTVTYGKLAKKLKTSPRAIGAACRSNPLPIFIPCHRVISSQGLGGYSGATEGPYLDIKAWLLRHETEGG